MLTEHLLGPSPEDMHVGQENKWGLRWKTGSQERPEGSDTLAGRRGGFWAEGMPLAKVKC